MTKLLGVLVASLLAVPAFAADRQEVPEFFTKLSAKVGSWAEYTYEVKKGEKTKTKGTLRVAVVGKQGDSYWLEQKMKMEIPKPKKETPFLMKTLVGKDGIEKAFMKTEAGVMDMTKMMAKAKDKKAAKPDGFKMTEIGKETIEVPAGRYKTTHFAFDVDKEKEPSHAWVKDGTGPYGLIKQEHKSRKHVTTIVLQGVGSGAKSELDEKKAAESPYAAAMAAASRDGKAPKGDARAYKGEKPTLGGLFKSAMKQKVGIPE